MDRWLSKNLINLLPMTFRILFLKRWHIKFFVTLVKISVMVGCLASRLMNAQIAQTSHNQP